jgi:hypothetical protein
MRRATRLLSVACLVLCACQSPTDPAEQLFVTLSTDRQVVSPGHPVEITITVVNLGPSIVRTADPGTYACAHGYSITDGEGHSLRLPEQICAAIGLSPRTLGPGESLVIHDRWEATESSGSLGATPVAPGTYRLAARVIGQHREATSEPVTLVVSTTGSTD